jgi:hypothetical protein
MCLAGFSRRAAGTGRFAALRAMRQGAGRRARNGADIEPNDTAADIGPGDTACDIGPNDTSADLLAKIAAMNIPSNIATNIAEAAAMMQDPELEYRGHVIVIKVRRFSAESDTGIFLTSVTLTPLDASGLRGAAVVLAKNSQGIYLDEAAAYDAAVVKTRTYLDRLAGE